MEKINEDLNWLKSSSDQGGMRWSERNSEIEGSQLDDLSMSTYRLNTLIKDISFPEAAI